MVILFRSRLKGLSSMQVQQQLHGQAVHAIKGAGSRIPLTSLPAHRCTSGCKILCQSCNLVAIVSSIQIEGPSKHAGAAAAQQPGCSCHQRNGLACPPCQPTCTWLHVRLLNCMLEQEVDTNPVQVQIESPAKLARELQWAA